VRAVLPPQRNPVRGRGGGQPAALDHPDRVRPGRGRQTSRPSSACGWCARPSACPTSTSSWSA
jgi:hypothetical protein